MSERRAAFRWKGSRIWGKVVSNPFIFSPAEDLPVPSQPATPSNVRHHLHTQRHALRSETSHARSLWESSILSTFMSSFLLYLLVGDLSNGMEGQDRDVFPSFAECWECVGWT